LAVYTGLAASLLCSFVAQVAHLPPACHCCSCCCARKKTAGKAGEHREEACKGEARCHREWEALLSLAPSAAVWLHRKEED
jgi:hypothetical protein